MIEVGIFADEVSSDFEEEVDLSARAGAHCIELRGGLWGRAVQSCTDEDVARAQEILAHTLKTVEENGWGRHFEVSATFCTEQCDKGPTLIVGGQVIHKAKLEDVSAALEREAQKRGA